MFRHCYVEFIYSCGIPKYLLYIFRHSYVEFIASLVAQMVKHMPAMQETWVQSLGWEDPLEKEMATHSSTLAWKIPWTEEPGRLQSMGLQTVRHNWVTSFHYVELIYSRGIAHERKRDSFYSAILVILQIFFFYFLFFLNLILFLNFT